MNLSITRVLLDYLTEPQGTESLPRLSWALESDTSGVFQTGYRIQVSEKEDFSVLLADSGDTDGQESSNVTMPTFTIASCTWYYVRVKANVKASTGECASSDWQTARFLTGHIEPWTAEFISAETVADRGNSAGTYLRKTFTAETNVVSAVLCATALGLYHVEINGKTAGYDQMAPGWTNYHKHLCYQTLDVTDLIQNGENAIGVHLGAGWFKGKMGFIHERCNYGPQTAFLAELLLRFADGTTRTVKTDLSWHGASSPVLFSEIYDGETYDARLEQPGFSLSDFMEELDPSWRPLTEEEKQSWFRDRMENPLTDEEKAAESVVAAAYRPKNILWHPVEAVVWPKEVLTPQPGSRVRIEQELPVKEIIITPQNDTVLDFGQNLTGWVRFKVHGQEGDRVVLHCFETLDAKGNAYFDNLRSAKQTITYICRGGEAVYEDLFTFQGFRYVRVESWPGMVQAEDFTACVVYSQMEPVGHFACSNPDVNRLQQNIEWSLRGNFLDIPTDCPQRDERMGWTGDAQIFCATATYLRNTWTFFSKWMLDVAADQTEEGGVAHIVPNTLQYFKITDWLLGQGIDSAAAWADVAVIIPWTLYMAYGDRRILEQQFDSMKGWIDFMQAHAKNNIWNYHLQFGDWVALDAEEGSYFGATPNDLTCTAYYAYSTGLFVKTCQALGKMDLAESYQALYDRVVKTFRETFFTPEGGMTVQTQTAHIVALHFHLCPPGTEAIVTKELKALLDKENGHLVTGFVGTPYFCFALSDNGLSDDAYALLLKDDFPSWLYEVKAGATTIWEHWDGRRPDGSMWSPDMNSFNHYAYGAVGEWMYRVIAGINTDENDPGYRTIRFAPKTNEALSWAEGSHETVFGTVSSRWSRDGSLVTLTLDVPVNTKAVLVLENTAVNPEGLSFVRNNEGLYEATILSGRTVVHYRVD